MIAFNDLKLDAVEAQLRAIANDSTIGEAGAFAQWLPGSAKNARALASHWDVMAASREIDCLILNLFPKARSELRQRDRLRRIAVARLALDHFAVAERLPECVLGLFPDFFQRLANYVSDGRKKYEDEYFGKDVRYALGVTVPGGALQFDLAGRIGPKLALREARRTRSPKPVLSWLGAHAWERWYTEHIDLRSMREFNPGGWTDHCRRMAQVLAQNPAAAGIVGAGWFYDPAVAEVSPALGYIQQTQTRHGAFLIRIGTEPHHIENALHRSAARRKLYEEGKYLPTCYMCAWPRKALLAWASRVESDPAASFAASNGLEIHRMKVTASEDPPEITTPRGAHLGAT